MVHTLTHQITMMNASQAMALSPRHSSVLRIFGSGIAATSKSAGSAGGYTDPATLTQQPLGH